MSSDSLIDFGGRRALFDGPDQSQSWLSAAITSSILRAVLAQPLVDTETRKLLFGRKHYGFDLIDFAKLEVSYGADGRDLALRFGMTGGPQVIVPLRHGSSRALTRQNRLIVLEMLLESKISIPVSRFDPTGAHARWNFPRNLTKEQAIEMVTNPPGPQAPLPTLPER